MKLAIGFVVVMSYALWPATVYAHAVGLQAKLKGETVVVEGYFDDDTPADDAKVTVEDETGKVVLEGKTDDKGVWSFPTPKPGKYKVKLDAGAGHRATTTFTIVDPAQATATDEQTVSEGPSRSEFTQTPWAKIALGLGLIGAVVLLWWWRKCACTKAAPLV